MCVWLRLTDNTRRMRQTERPQWGTSRFACRAATCVLCYISIYDGAALLMLLSLFFFWKENGLWKAIQQQQQQQRELLWKILSSEKKIWNVHYSWQIFALTFCFLSVNFCLTRFLFFMFYSHSACSWQLGWHARPYPWTLCLWWRSLCFANQPASLTACLIKRICCLSTRLFVCRLVYETLWRV